MLRGRLSPVSRVSTRKPLHNTLLVRGYSIVRGTHCLVLECWPFTGKGSENRYIRFVPTAQRTVTVRLFRTKRYVLTPQWTIPQPVPRAAVIQWPFYRPLSGPRKPVWPVRAHVLFLKMFSFFILLYPRRTPFRV